MIICVVRHPVEDFDRWKAGFDAFPPTSGGGALFARVNRDLNDPNMVAVVMGMESVEAAEGFLNDPELKAKMEESGVSGPPRVEMYEEVDVLEA